MAAFTGMDEDDLTDDVEGAPPAPRVLSQFIRPPAGISHCSFLACGRVGGASADTSADSLLSHV